MTLAAANDPFVGKWKLDQAKSHIQGVQVKIASAGDNKYTISFGDITDTLVADGTDQPIHFGRTEALTFEGRRGQLEIMRPGKKVSGS